VAVIDRKAQRLSLYLDDKLDTPGGEPGEENPADISTISASKWPARVTLGGLEAPPERRRAPWEIPVSETKDLRPEKSPKPRFPDGPLGDQHPFVGWLDDVAVVAAALAPGPELEAALASVKTEHPTRHVASGSYLSPVYDWGVEARGTELTVATELNSGGVTATIEVSDDGFRTVRSKTVIQVEDGVRAYVLPPDLGVTRAIRVRFDLSRGSDPDSSPVIDGFRVVGQPADQPATAGKPTGDGGQPRQ
jgi:hypothetical protein